MGEPRSNLDHATSEEAALSSCEERVPYVVGIGASAGGLEALETFFANMPVETGMAFVVVQHLSPDFKSLMDELLARKTALPIHRASDQMEVRPNAIYLIPPKKDMIVANRRLFLTDKDPRQGLTLPIDHFFRSLAHDLGDRAIAVILSGTGSDGSRGIREIHDAGGLVVVQSPETAKFDGMPNSARKSGAVDLVLPPQEMPAALLQYIRHLDAPTPSMGVPAPQRPESGFDAVFRMLRDTYALDFSHYKANTVTRRIERRLLLTHSSEFGDYVRRLREDPRELDALYRDLLIGVTHFFRDKQAFERLRQDVLPGLLAELPRDEELRVWVAGCATGEEAYSLGILIHEQVEALGRPIKVKIFATDVHCASLEHASSGAYTEGQLADVAPERIERYFVRTAEGYQIAPELRQMIVFAPHNLLKDAPFTKLDLITCRNLLIYFQPAMQKKVLSLFHFGLKTGGVLVLGPSESPGELSDEFVTIDAHRKIYKKRRDIHLPTDLRLPVSPRPPGLPARWPTPRPSDHHLVGTYDALLDEYMSASFLINERRELVQTFAGANSYLRVKEGRLSTDILDMVDAGMRVVLGGVLPRVFHEKTSVTYKGLRVSSPAGDRLVNLMARPVTCRRSGAIHALVVFEAQDNGLPSVADTEARLEQAPHAQLQAVEAELTLTKDNLQSTIEELETSYEELQASNEELVASNEELQSTNEELHSVNEELYTVNAEYQKKIAELTRLTADMDNLLESTQVHTLFLDRALRIRKFTPRIADTFHLLPQDVGRRIDNFTHNIDYAELMSRLTSVLDTGQPFEEQVRDRPGNWFLLRILPYRSQEEIGGCVLTLIDLSSLKRAEAATREAVEQNDRIMTDVTRLQRAEQETREAVEQRDRFLAMLSHELRNPLGAIVNAAGVLERSSSDPPTRHEALHVLHRQTVQMGRLLDDLLDIARIKQGKIQLQQTAVDLGQLMDEAVSVAQPAFDAGEVSLETRLPQEPVVVSGDPARLQQLLVNLLMNAIKYTPPGGRVQLALNLDGGEAVARVQDTGVGIRPDMLEKVFELFVQGDDTLHRSTSGLGLGLTLVRSIAELHGGRVRASSAGLGQGSAFTVWLPLASDKSLPRVESPRPVLGKSRLRIVVVEDNEDSRRMLEAMLKLDGHEVIGTRDGEEGLSAIERERPRVAIVDLGLPKLDGYELARRVRQSEAGKAIYLVALTGYGQGEDRKKGSEAGFDEHLVKPLKRGELEQVLQRVCQQP